MATRILTHSNKYLAHLISQARSRDTGSEVFRSTLRQIGNLFGYEISNSLEYDEIDVVTPLNVIHRGTKLHDTLMIVSSFEDAEYFAAGLHDVFPSALFGKIDAVRTYMEGRWRAPIQRVELPRSIPEENIVVIAKAVLASGCTAISLIGEAMEVAKPKGVIVAAVIAHQNACQEIASEYPYVNIDFVIGEVDPILNESGYVVPGIGNISTRLN